MNIFFIYSVTKQRVSKFLDNPYAIFYFLKRNCYDKFVADSFVPFYKQLNFLSAEDSLNYVIDNNLSIVRLGDGEFGLIRGASVYFNDWRQKYNKELQRGLIEVISAKDKGILVCLPEEHLCKTMQDLKKEGRSSEFLFWINAKMVFHRYASPSVLYGSSFAFYPMVNKHINYHKLKNYFDTKNIIIITSSLERFKSLSLGKTTSLIESPKSDAWDALPLIRKDLQTILNSKDFKKEDTLIMVSMGPGAKVFVLELMRQGYTAWDAGQFFDLASSEIKKLGTL